MRYEDAVKLEELATAAHDARQLYEALGMTNRAGKTIEEQRELSVKYAMARAELEVAQGRLDRAHGKMYLHGKL